MRRINAYRIKYDANIMTEGVSDKDWTTTLLLCVLLGTLGIHRFTTGHMGIGVLYLLTAGGCGIGVIYDLVMIITEKYVDGDGNVIMKA